MREAVIVASSRTPLAKSFRGSLNRTRPDDQAAHCIRDVLRKVPQLAPEEVGDVILGCAEPSGPQGMNVADLLGGELGHFAQHLADAVRGLVVRPSAIE